MNEEGVSSPLVSILALSGGALTCLENLPEDGGSEALHGLALAALAALCALGQAGVIQEVDE